MTAAQQQVRRAEVAILNKGLEQIEQWVAHIRRCKEIGDPLEVLKEFERGIGKLTREVWEAGWAESRKLIESGQMESTEQLELFPEITTKHSKKKGN